MPSVSREPAIRRERMSRPSWSVPSQCDGEPGGSSRSASTWRSGSCGMTNGATSAIATSAARIASPRRFSGLPAKWRQRRYARPSVACRREAGASDSSHARSVVAAGFVRE